MLSESFGTKNGYEKVELLISSSQRGKEAVVAELGMVIVGCHEAQDFNLDLPMKVVKISVARDGFTKHLVYTQLCISSPELEATER